ncbi:MAG TPA: hypothetical protein PKD80_03980 [Microthrixaceae bacterium]|nr:hypothetical protein [Microthrixaceae bacterium]HMT23745.1 hypothetical protein [Microthrixaceae bacterium]HMT62158.1 hypothetical protein [Microthrixaceae bacterium]
MKRALAAIAASTLLLAACGGESTDDAGSADSAATSDAAGQVLKVPGDFPTIQAAVDKAASGDLVLISPGVYKEGVVVETPDIVIRGLDRNKVIIDGEFTRDNGIKVFSNGVAVENLTVRNNTGNGVFFTGEYNDDTSKNKILTGYRASYVTAYNNGLYGIYAFNATKGQFDHDYGSGHPDSAFYIGQCNPCDAVVADSVGEMNMLGYSGTNSTGVTLVNNTFSHNRAGIVPNSLHSEKLAPNSGTVIVGNTVTDNNAADAPNNSGIAIAFGNGIVLGGVSNNVAERNLVTGHTNAGIVITDMPDSKNPETDKNETFKPENNKVRSNKLSGNTMDLAYLTVNYASTLFGNCFEDNEITTEFPEGLQAKSGCGAPDADLGDLTPILSKLTPPPADVDWKTVAAPADQENMPNAAKAAAVPAKSVPMKVDVDAIKTPTA